MKQILVVSHCILNNASKVVSYNEEEIREEALNREILLHYIMENNIQLIQLPCPELMMYGSRRWGHVKEQFMHSFFRKQCREMLEPIILQLKEYASCPERFQLMAVVAIDGSPSCGHSLTCKGNWGGEFTGLTNFDEKINSLSIVDEAGVFMEELQILLEAEELDIPIKDLSKIINEFTCRKSVEWRENEKFKNL
ncbi:MAG: hypothetical protein PHF63_07610 [Herbinix sp.]|nr:hypothetical protein [Herbinix sp.]